MCGLRDLCSSQGASRHATRERQPRNCWLRQLRVRTFPPYARRSGQYCWRVASGQRRASRGHLGARCGVGPHREQLLLTPKSVLEPPPLTPVRGHFKVQAAAIVETRRALASLGLLNNRIGEFVVRHLGVGGGPTASLPPNLPQLPPDSSVATRSYVEIESSFSPALPGKIGPMWPIALSCLERVRGIEPLYEAWEAAVLPLNYTRRARRF